MKKANGGTGAPLGVLAEIAGLLEGITPEQYIVPGASIERGDHVVALATDDIKRLFTLRSQLTEKMKELVASANDISGKAMARIHEIGTRAAGEEIETPGAPLCEAKTKSREIGLELRGTGNLAKIVDGIFWLEVKRQHPCLESKPVAGIHNDWSLTWAEDDDDGASINVVAGSGQIATLAEALRELLYSH